MCPECTVRAGIRAIGYTPVCGARATEGSPNYHGLDDANNNVSVIVLTMVGPNVNCDYLKIGVL